MSISWFYQDNQKVANYLKVTWYVPFFISRIIVVNIQYKFDIRCFVDIKFIIRSKTVIRLVDNEVLTTFCQPSFKFAMITKEDKRTVVSDVRAQYWTSNGCVYVNIGLRLLSDGFIVADSRVAHPSAHSPSMIDLRQIDRFFYKNQ